MREMKNSYKILFGTAEEKGSLRRPKNKQEDNIKM
jgi:hypothetical protein